MTTALLRPGDAIRQMLVAIEACGNKGDLSALLTGLQGIKQH
jgi:hypothetical protein